MAQGEHLEQVEVASTQELWDWLALNHGRSESVWLVTWKAADRARYVSRDAVLDALIAYGWIDGRRKVLDDRRTMQLIGPRKQKAWAQTYKDRAARLMDEGRMQPPGLRAIEEAKAAGLWDASAAVDALVVPDDLRTALDQSGGAAFFDAAAPSYRRNVLRWIAGAKKPETRAKRVGELAARSAAGEKVPQY